MRGSTSATGAWTVRPWAVRRFGNSSGAHSDRGKLAVQFLPGDVFEVQVKVQPEAVVAIPAERVGGNGGGGVSAARVADVGTLTRSADISESGDGPDLRRAELTERSGLGCRVMDWNGHSVTLACFRIEGGQIAHLLVIDRNNLPDAPHSGTRAMASLNGMNTAAWSGDNQTYLLVSSGPPEMLERLL